MFNNISTYLKSEDARISILKKGLHVLNYKKIVDITSEEVIFKTEDSLIKVKGTNMFLVKLDKNELLINGKIKSVDINE